MRRTLFIVLAALLLLVSCATKGAQYPEADYVRATGYGATMEEAELKAKTALASLFGLSISTDSTRSLLDTYAIDEHGNESRSYGEYFTNVSNVSVTADNLYGVQVIERVKGKDECAVTVVMERKTTSEYYLAQIEQGMETIMALEAIVPSEIGTFKGLEDAVSLAKLGEKCNTQTVMYNYLTGEEHDFYSLASAYSLIDQARRAIVLSVVVTGDDSGSVLSSVSRIFTSDGVAIAKGDVEPTSVATVTINWQESQGTGVASSFVFEEYNTDISVMDLAGNQVIFVMSLNGKEGHQSYEGAKTRAVKGMVSEIGEKLGSELAARFSL